jgi:hypothetical protein
MLHRVILFIALTGVASAPAWSGNPSSTPGKGDRLTSPGTAATHLRAVIGESANEFPALHIPDDLGTHGIKVLDFGDELRSNLRPVYAPIGTGYEWERFTGQSSAIGWDIGVAYGLAAVIGFSEWDWGGAPFHTTQEGWFGRDTEYLGMDKLGHAYTGYLLSEYFTQRISHSVDDPTGAALTGGLLGMGIQTYVELLDGFSENGFSPEDFVADGIGVGFSILRNTVPGLAAKLDFRMEYVPSGNKGAFEPYSDYSGQKYLLALKLSGFETFEDTPLRFVELQAGYYARGFTEEERSKGKELRREPYVAVGLNLQELLDGTAVRDDMPVLMARRTLEYVQLPYTYLSNN